MSSEKQSLKSKNQSVSKKQISADRIRKVSGAKKQGKPSVQIVTVEELNRLERDTSETAKAIIRSMRKTYQNTYGGKKVKSA
jgi:hypothetical protein